MTAKPAVYCSRVRYLQRDNRVRVVPLVAVDAGVLFLETPGPGLSDISDDCRFESSPFDY